MKISGVTVIRNAELMGYPVVPSIRSILPLVDEFIVAVGKSDDNTRQIIESIGDPKIKIIDTIWDTSKTQGGLMLSEKTNEAIGHCAGDWCFYLQADEVVHEADLPKIKESLMIAHPNPEVEGLVFDYTHFYGSFRVIAKSRNWYRREVRVIRNRIGIKSVGDAQGFRKGEQKPKVIPSGGRIFHYGWVKEPEKMGQKSKLLSRWWHGNRLDESFNQFAYKKGYGLNYFKGTHPEVMRELVAQETWQFDPKASILDWNLKDFKNFASDIVENLTGVRLGEHKNYILLK